jgi:hypothetical protein
MLELQGAWTLCERMSRTTCKGEQIWSLFKNATKRDTMQGDVKRNHFKTLENGITEDVANTRRRHNKV